MFNYHNIDKVRLGFNHSLQGQAIAPCMGVWGQAIAPCWGQVLPAWVCEVRLLLPAWVCEVRSLLPAWVCEILHKSCNTAIVSVPNKAWPLKTF
jgi:hypothetical protein